MDDLTIVLEQAKRIIDEQPWYEDDYGRCLCFFCTENHPDHADDCPYKLLKQVFQKSEMAMRIFLSFATIDYSPPAAETGSTDRAYWMEM